MALSPYALITLAQGKSHLGIPVGDLTFDPIVEDFINEATLKIESYTDRKLKERPPYTEHQDGFANDRILLHQWPVTDVDELWIDPTGDFTDVQYKLAASAYAIDYASNGEGIGINLLSRCFFPRGRKNIRIVYTAGYSAIPPDLAGACKWTLSYLWDMRNNKSVGVDNKGKNQENVTYRGNLPQYVLDTLENYRRSEWPTGGNALGTR